MIELIETPRAILVSRPYVFARQPGKGASFHIIRPVVGQDPSPLCNEAMRVYAPVSTYVNAVNPKHACRKCVTEAQLAQKAGSPL